MLLYLNTMLANIALGDETKDDDYFRTFKTLAFKNAPQKRDCLTIFKRSKQNLAIEKDSCKLPLNVHERFCVLISTIQILCHKFLISSFEKNNCDFKKVNKKIILPILNKLCVEFAIEQGDKQLDNVKRSKRKIGLVIAKRYKKLYKSKIVKIVDDIGNGIMQGKTSNVSFLSVKGRKESTITSKIKILMETYAPEAHRFCLEYGIYMGKIDIPIEILTTTNYNFFVKNETGVLANNNDLNRSLDFANMMCKRLILIIMCVLNITDYA